MTIVANTASGNDGLYWYFGKEEFLVIVLRAIPLRNVNNSTFASLHSLTQRRKGGEIQVIILMILGNCESAERSASYASAGERRDGYAIEMASILHLNEIEQAKLELIKQI